MAKIINPPPRSPSKPGALGWSIAMLSCLALVTLVLFLVSLEDQVEERVSYRDLAKLMQEDNFLQATIVFEQLAEEPDFLQRVSSSFSTERSRNTQLWISDIREIYNSLMLIRQGDVEGATTVFEKKRDQWFLTLSKRPPTHGSSETASSDRLDQIFEEIAEGLSVYNERHRKVEQIRAQIAKIEHSSQTSIVRFQRQAPAVARFFTLSLEQPPDDESRMAFYSRGVLKYLPRLRGLPDGIDNLRELKDHVERLNGSVQVDAENAYQQFKETLLQFRTTFSQFVTNFMNDMDKIIDLEVDYDLHEARRREAREQVRVVYTELFLLRAQPYITLPKPVIDPIERIASDRA